MGTINYAHEFTIKSIVPHNLERQIVGLALKILNLKNADGLEYLSEKY